ncbi:general secretion pathway protein GspD [Massilia sp. P8910]|uniref:secretin N-terminal domain-containing protein n=1 Tax=Massilia antarctica TaxID=2765360 RepID=UPI001E2CFF8A|nr:secretin N-terminal domain-containing protein [Massilia antarctica]MCE3605107.1 general secretion pathway protein GspD [Massilia antarctica]
MRNIARNVALICSLAGLAACAAGPQPAPPDIRILLDAGKLEEGMARLEQVLAATPGHIEARVLLANTRIELTNRVLAQAAQDVARGSWDAAQEGYRRAAALGAVDQSMIGMRSLASAQAQAQALASAEQLLAVGKREEAGEALRALLARHPKNQRAGKLLQALRERAESVPGSTALGKAFQKRLSLRFHDAPLRAVLESMSRTSGISFTLDKDVPADLRVTLNLQDTSIEQALRNLLMSVQMEQRIVDEHTVLLYPNDAAKQREYQKLTIRSFRIANAEAKTVANSLRTLLKTRDLVVDEKLNMLVLRDTPETILMAAKLVALHDVAEPEVMLEVEILEVQRSDLESLGVKWPGNVSLTPLGASTVMYDGSVTTSPFTLNDLKNLTSRGLLASVDPMRLSASVNRDNVSVLANPRIRIKSREKALIRVGERVPSVSANVTSTGVTSQSVNYLDVGLKLEAEPVVYMDDEVSIKLNLEVSSILGTIFDSHDQPYGYRIGARNASTVLRLRDGENQVLAGLISDNEKRSSSAVPGLGELPVLDRLFGSKGRERTKTEIVLSITPHVLRNQERGAGGEVEFDAGTDGSLRGQGGHAGQPGQAAPQEPAPPVPAPAPASALLPERSGG